MNIPNIEYLTNQTPKPVGDGYLKFQLNQFTSAVFSIRYVQEVMIVPIEFVTSMPNMPACVLGLTNWRSRIIWVVDLPKMFNLESLNNKLRQYNVIIIRIESALLGLVVPEVKGTIRLIADDIKSPGSQISPSLLPYLRGCVWQEKEFLLVFDPQAIVQSSIF